MKTLRTLFLLLAVTGGCLLAKGQEIKALENDQYSISLNDVTLVVDAAHGGKILSYRYQDKEVLNQGRFPNSFGSTFWTSPQAQWNWPPVPEYDTRPFTAEQQDGALVLTGSKSERFGYRIRKKLQANPQDGSFVITYSIINESGETRQVAPWEISRVPNGGLLFFEASAVEPANNMEGLPFTFSDGIAWYQMDEAQMNRKINADGKGWLAFCNGSVLFVKKFQDLAEGQAAPAEAEIQVYANPGKTFVEIEEQGAFTTLQPGESVDWTVCWYLLPLEGTEGALDAVKKLL
jgi:hypothetical protein